MASQTLTELSLAPVRADMVHCEQTRPVPYIYPHTSKTCVLVRKLSDLKQ